MKAPSSTRRSSVAPPAPSSTGAASPEVRTKSVSSIPAPSPSNRRVPPPVLRPDVLDGAAPRGSEGDHTRLDTTRTSPETNRTGPRGPSRYRRLYEVARTVVGGALVISISCAVAWGARRHLTESQRFAVTDIEVSGGKQRNADAIEAEAGIARGQNIFTIDLDRARAKLLADPWISEATLARRLPGTILVQVTEREAGAIVALPESYLASQTGEIFKRLEIGDPVDLPIVTGITSDQIAADREGVAQMIRRAEDLANDYEHGPLGERAPLEEVHLGQDGAVKVIVGKDGVTIALGTPPFRRKLEEAARVFGELDRRGSKADAILIDNDARPERVVVRMR